MGAVVDQAKLPSNMARPRLLRDSGKRQHTDHPNQQSGSAARAALLRLGLRACGHLRLLFPYTRLMSRYDRPSHRVYMSFFFKSGWQVQFLEADLKTALPRKLTFSDPEKIRELARRGEAWATSESRQMLELAIEQGRGGLYLKLTAEQYSKLRQMGRAN
jgi:hypothetical protein